MSRDHPHRVFLDQRVVEEPIQGIETRYIVHDATAREVDEHTFFHTRESGGTMISSAYRLAAQILEADYPSSEWNIYPFHFSDGDWLVDDTLSIQLLKDVLPANNQLATARESLRLWPVHQRFNEHFDIGNESCSPCAPRSRTRMGSLDRSKSFWGRIQYLKVRPLPAELEAWRVKIEKIAEDQGLDFFDTRFEVTYDKMSEIAAYGGFPTRYPHWRFGGVRTTGKVPYLRPVQDLRTGHQ